MKLALHGYGKMGHAVEKVAKESGHEVVAIFTSAKKPGLNGAEAIIDFSNAAAVDSAPDTGSWTYDLELKAVLNTLAARFSPAKPRAGKAFRLAETTLRLEDGTTVKADSITCVAKLMNGRAWIWTW